jgi:hypothetical protein
MVENEEQQCHSVYDRACRRFTFSGGAKGASTAREYRSRSDFSAAPLISTAALDEHSYRSPQYLYTSYIGHQSKRESVAFVSRNLKT